MGYSARDRLIVALDVETGREARELFRSFRDVVDNFKIGSQLFTAAGPDLVREIAGDGGRVFLDLKFHDIPNTVAAASREATRLGVFMFNVHALGGSEMMRRAAEAVTEVVEREGRARPIVLAVTVLTSADASTLAEVGLSTSMGAQVSRLARLAAACGIDGVVASPHEVEAVRAAVKKPKFIVVTPGVRPPGSARDDQRRVMTSAEAVRAGADYLVVGRAILKASDPARAVDEIMQDMDSAIQRV